MGTPLVQYYLSGGAANTDPAASLGGDRSTAEVTTQTAASALAAPFSIVRAAGHVASKIGDGTLTYVAASTALTWQPNGGTVGPAVPIAASETVSVPDGDNAGYLTVGQAATPAAPIIDTATTVTIGHSLAGLFPTVDSVASANGFIRHRLIWMLNSSAVTLTGWQGYIADAMDAGEVLDFGYDPAGPNGTVGIIATESTPPPGVIFDAPTSLAGGTLAPNIPAGEALPIWLRSTLVGSGTESLPSAGILVLGQLP